MSVENCKGGWDALVAFAQERDCQNREDILRDGFKRKGIREQQAWPALSIMRITTVAIVMA